MNDGLCWKCKEDLETGKPIVLSFLYCYHEPKEKIIDYDDILKLPETMAMKRLDKIINSLYRIEVLLKNGNKTV